MFSLFFSVSCFWEESFLIWWLIFIPYIIITTLNTTFIKVEKSPIVNRLKTLIIIIKTIGNINILLGILLYPITNRVIKNILNIPSAKSLSKYTTRMLEIIVVMIRYMIIALRCSTFLFLTDF